MVRKRVVFQGNGVIKDYHLLTGEEHNILARALYTGHGMVWGDNIILGQGVNLREKYPTPII